MASRRASNTSAICCSKEMFEGVLWALKKTHYRPLLAVRIRTLHLRDLSMNLVDSDGRRRKTEDPKPEGFRAKALGGIMLIRLSLHVAPRGIARDYDGDHRSFFIEFPSNCNDKAPIRPSVEHRCEMIEELEIDI